MVVRRVRGWTPVDGGVSVDHGTIGAIVLGYATRRAHSELAEGAIPLAA